MSLEAGICFSPQPQHQKLGELFTQHLLVHVCTYDLGMHVYMRRHEQYTGVWVCTCGCAHMCAQMGLELTCVWAQLCECV